MQNFNAVFCAEHIKIRKKGIYLISILLSVLVPILYFGYCLKYPDTLSSPLPFNLFERCYSKVTPLTGFFWPLLIIVNASRLAQIDHKLGGWQWMEIQPVARLSIYFAKFLVLVSSMLAGVAAFFITSVILSFLLPFFIDIPEVASQHLYILPLLHFMLRIAVSMLCLMAFQYALSVLMSGFIGPIIIGFVLLFLSSILNSFHLSPRWDFMEFISTTGENYKGGDLGNLLIYPEKFSLIVAAFFSLAGFWWYYKKTIRRAFFKNGKQVLSSLGVLAVFGALFFFIYTPKRMEPFGKTVLTGSIDSPLTIEKITVTHPSIGDTLAVIKVKDNKFSHEMKGEVPLENYRLTFDYYFQTNVTFSTGDSIHVKMRFYNDKHDSKITGTRLAENQSEPSASSFRYIPYFLANNVKLDRPGDFFSTLYDEYKRVLKKKKNFVTPDNYEPRKDFTDKEQKLIAIQCLNYTYEYINKRKVVYPDEKTRWSENIAALKNEVKTDDQSLLGSEEYIQYLGYALAEDDQTEPSPFRELRAVAKLEEGTFRNRLLFSNVRNGLTNATSNEERTKIYSQYAHLISGTLKQSIDQTYQSFLRIGKGNPAPPIEATDLENKPVSLADFKGKYVIIDVWATWCGPCRTQSPIFEKQANTYHDKNIKFIALSTDEDPKKWFVEAKQKSPKVLQLRVNNKDQLIKDYQIPGIPHFIFIDPQGKIISANYSRPSEESFETILRHELKVKEDMRLPF